MSSYDYPPPAQGQNEPYRASPTNSHSSLPSVSLRLILAMDSENQPQQQRPQQQSNSQVALGSPLPPSMGQYYHNQGQSLPPPPHHMSVTSDPSQQMRYPLPAPDNRIMSGGRHKKEIKRRTKTGCLTCRKRRIKCDEGHPSCRNCQKSKRECLGYDPIFKAQPAPAAIQPAPSGSPSLQAAATTASPYPAPPQGYMSASNNPPYGPSLSTGMASPGSSTEPYDYTAAIDPALEGAGASSLQGQSYGGAQGYGQDPNSYSAGRGGASQFSIPLRYQLSSSVEHKTHGQYRTASLCFSIVDSSLLVAAYTAISGKRIKIDDLFALEGVPPPPLTPAPPMTANHDEMKTIYTTVYAPFIDKFLETRWFQTRGLNHLLQDSALCERFTTLISRYTMPHDFHGAAVTRSLEASVIWSIMSLCRRVASTPASSSGQVNYLEVNDGVQDASKRLTIFESLVTKQYIDTEVPAQTEITGNGTVFDNQLKYREREFWRLLEKFLTIHDAKEGAAKEIDDTLGACRVILDSRENRDVLYSIAIIRAVGQRVAEFPDRLPPPVNNSEQDNRTKLSVAKKFIESEAAGGGTNQVIQRLCGMAHRSWMLRR